MLRTRAFRGRLAGLLTAAALGAGAVVSTSPAAAAVPAAAWRVDIPGVIGWSAPAVADIDGDGVDDVAVTARDGFLRVYRADGSVMWAQPVVPQSSQVPVAVDSSPTVADLDGDGRPEILVGAGSIFVPNQSGGIVVFDSAGNVKWRTEFNDIFSNWNPAFGARPDGFREFVLASPAVGDINGDGQVDVVVAAQDNRIYVLNGRDGSPLPGWISEANDVDGPGYWIDDTVFSSPVVYDGDHDGRDEIYVGVTATSGPTYNFINHSGGVFVALGMENGRAHMQWINTYDEVIVSSPALGDIDGDGRPELVFGAGYEYARSDGNRQAWRQIFAVHADDGSSLPGWPQTTNGSTESSPALGDLDGDGVPEVVAVTDPQPGGDGLVYAWKGSGAGLWAVPPNRCYDYGCEGGGGIRSAPVIADLDGNGTQDVAVANGWGTFLLRGSDGARLGDALEIGRTNQGGLAVGSFGARGSMLVIPSYLNGASTVAAIPLAATSAVAEWPQFHHNAARDGRHRGVRAGGAFVGIEPTPSGGGYWLVTAAGDVQPHGNAPAFGSASGLAAGERVASISATPNGRGYWLFTSRGRVLTFGNAANFGDMSAATLNGPVLDSVATPSGQGYYMVASDGGVFAFGDATFAGSMGGQLLNAPVQSLVPDPDGAGYWLVASDGGVFAFDAGFRGSMGSTPLNKPVSGMVPYGNGYVLLGEDGGAFVFSDQPFSGSLGANPPALPVIDIAVVPQGAGYWMLDTGGTVYPFGNARVFP